MSLESSNNIKWYRFPDREHKEFIHQFQVDIDVLVSYFTERPELSPFYPFIPEVAGKPHEIWQTFQKNTVSGRVRLRHYFVKALKLKEGDHGFVLVFEAIKGGNICVEFLVFSEANWSDRLNQYRRGKLIYAKDDKS